MKNYGFGLIGCGRIASRHAKSIAEIESAKLVASADIIRERAVQISASFGGKPFNDYRYLLDNKQIRIINICTPSGSHAQIAKDAIESGKHVIVEKPMAMNLVDADQMIRLSEEYKVKICVVLQNRFNPVMQELHQLVTSGDLGRIYITSAVVRWYRDQKYYEDGWHGSLIDDGGVVLNQSIHAMDAIQWIAGPIVKVRALTDTLGHEIESPDTLLALLEFANGGVGAIEASTLSYPRDLEASISVMAERGTIKVGGKALNQKEIWNTGSELGKSIDKSGYPDPPNVYGFSHRAVIEDMIRAVDTHSEPSIDGYEGRKSLSLATAIIESAQSDRTIFL